MEVGSVGGELVAIGGFGSSLGASGWSGDVNVVVGMDTSELGKLGEIGKCWGGLLVG